MCLSVKVLFCATRCERPSVVKVATLSADTSTDKGQPCFTSLSQRCISALQRCEKASQRSTMLKLKGTVPPPPKKAVLNFTLRCENHNAPQRITLKCNGVERCERPQIFHNAAETGPYSLFDFACSMFVFLFLVWCLLAISTLLIILTLNQSGL